MFEVEGDDESESDVSSDMFPTCIAPSPDGTALIEVAPPERPELLIPPVPNCDGKGWGPKTFATEQEQLVASRAFLHAIAEEDWNKVNSLLAYRVDLEFCNDIGMTALHLAISKRHKELVRFLIGQGIDVRCVTDNGQTPLHFACAHNDLRLVALLLNIHKRNGEEHDKTIHRTTKLVFRFSLSVFIPVFFCSFFFFLFPFFFRYFRFSHYFYCITEKTEITRCIWLP